MRTVRRIVRKSRGNVTALVDVEIMAYQACCMSLEERHVGEGEYTWHCDSKAALATVRDRLREVQRETNAYRLILAVGSPSNWRKKLEPTYKSNRNGKKKPLGYNAVIAELGKAHVILSQPWFEADDLLGVAHTSGEYGDTVLVSADKDMLTVPGKLYNPDSPTPKVVTIEEEDADFNHAIRALAGDAADGYKGCQGIGEKTATENVAGWRARGSDSADVYAKALELFESRGHTPGYGLLQLKLSRVLRECDIIRREDDQWDIQTWKPPAPRKPRRFVRVK